MNYFNKFTILINKMADPNKKFDSQVGFKKLIEKNPEIYGGILDTNTLSELHNLLKDRNLPMSGCDKILKLKTPPASQMNEMFRKHMEDNPDDWTTASDSDYTE